MFELKFAAQGHHGCVVIMFGADANASKLRKIWVMVGCAMRTKMPTGRYFHGAHGAPYLNLLALGLMPDVIYSNPNVALMDGSSGGAVNLIVALKISRATHAPKKRQYWDYSGQLGTELMNCMVLNELVKGQ